MPRVVGNAGVAQINGDALRRDGVATAGQACRNDDIGPVCGDELDQLCASAREIHGKYCRDQSSRPVPRGAQSHYRVA